MKRDTHLARNDWVQIVEDQGLTYHSFGVHPSTEIGNDGCYWDETVSYSFSLPEIETIEAATEELHQRCLDAVAHIVKNPHLMDNFEIPEKFRPMIIESWERNDPYIKGRFDLLFDPSRPELTAPKMLEYNCDTPTTAIETSVIQWMWKNDVHPDADQFNSLHEELIDRYSRIRDLMPEGAILHFTSFHDAPEERQHIEYYMELAMQGGIKVKHVPINMIGLTEDGEFVDQDDIVIRFLDKLYPWEWMFAEEFGDALVNANIGFLEPIWKALLSNKAILAVLWDLFPDHPNLLPAYFSPDKLGDNYVAKPILAREGANIKMVSPDGVIESHDAGYRSRNIYQARVNVPHIDNHYIVIGSWCVGETACGMVIREQDDSPIVVSDSKIVPHYIV